MSCPQEPAAKRRTGASVAALALAGLLIAVPGAAPLSALTIPPPDEEIVNVQYCVFVAEDEYVVSPVLPALDVATFLATPLDIVPPFTYGDFNGRPVFFEGINWAEPFITIYLDDCVRVVATTTTTTTAPTTTTTAPTTTTTAPTTTAPVTSTTAPESSEPGTTSTSAAVTTTAAPTTTGLGPDTGSTTTAPADLPPTGSSSSLPVAVIAAALVASGAALLARRVR